jgi:hypothetical protein
MKWVVGNSGGCNQPHLHIRVQKPGSVKAPYSGDLLPERFNGRYLVRNDRVLLPYSRNETPSK